MEILTLIVSVALAGGALLLIVAPLRRQSSAALPTSASGQTHAELEVRYQAALVSIKDLMFDFEMGKMSRQDYDNLLAKSKLEAAKIRKELDRLESGSHISATLDAEIEALVAQTRGKLQRVNGNAALLQDVDNRIQRLKAAGCNGHVTTCPTCNARVKFSDAYCASCGHTLDEVTAPAAAKNVCSACRAPVQPGDAFCAGCGQSLDPMSLPYQELSTT
jgi:hypothetical protein